MSSEHIFSVKDKVIVKRRGYPDWPAFISGIRTNSESQPIYDVYFYGTGNYSECKSEVLSLYEENKNKLGKSRGKLKKFKKFAEALLQIENDTKTDFQPENNVKVDVEESMPSISTESLNGNLSLESESKNVNEIELNLKNEEKLVNDTSLYEENKNKLGKSRGKSRGKLKKFKKIAEALIQIENDAKTDFKHENNVKVDVEESMPSISTESLNEKLSFESESKNVNEIELNLKNEENLVNETSLSKRKKVVKSRKRVSNSTNLKRKLSNVRHGEVSKKLKTSKIIIPTEDQPIVLLEQLNDSFLARKINGKQVSI